MDWQAVWIWDGSEASPRNAWRCFRRSFVLEASGWTNAQIAITADSRYQLWVNGVFVGRGPVRSWPSAQMFDTYDVGHLLRRDEPNAIAVLVNHYGLSTFSYLRGRGGLLAQLDVASDGEVVQTIASDASWRTSTHLGHDPRAPRLSQQLGFTEQYDARRWHDGWRDATPDDAWEFAIPIGRVGTAPWTGVVPRDIPPLADEAMRPIRVESLSRVEPVPWTTSIDVRNQLVPGAADHADHALHAGYLATIVRVPTAVNAVLGFPSAMASVFGPCAVNGGRVEPERFRGVMPERYLDVELRAGDNWLVFDVTALDHGNGFHLGIDTELPFELVSPIAAGPDDSPFVSIGPFPADPVWPSDATWRDGRMGVALPDDREQYEFAATLASRADLERLGALVRPVPLARVSQTNVFANCVWVRSRTERPVPFGLQMLASGSAAPVEIPRDDQGDTEIVVDFGRILSGFLDIDVEAPDGAVFDFYGFEFLRDGMRQDTFRVDNTLRYTCRAGRQRYLSAVRRGLRYLMLVVRGTPGPVRVHDLVVHQSNYPAPEVGRFQCSDALLNDIWEISRHTTRVCMEDTFVDCPTYEQAFWVGDSRNESLVAYHAFGAEALVRRCLRLVPGSRQQTPFYGSQVPSGWTNVIPDWTFLWVLACREHYERTGDAAFAREIWPHVRFTLDAYLAQRNADGLLSISAWNLLDWAPMDQPNDGVVTHQNCFMVAALRAAGELADLAGEDGADAYRAAASDLARAIDRHLWSDERGAYIDAIHPDGRRSTIFSVPTQVVAYLCGVATGERADRATQHMLEPQPDFVPIGSPFMSFFHYEALAKLRRVDAMLEDMRVNYGAMLAYGATTCWEMYPNYTALRANPKFPTRSHCHAWSAGPLYFLSAHVLGVRPLAPGWTRVAVEPVPAGLSWANGCVPLPGDGSVDVAWSVDPDGRRMHMTVSAPGHVVVEARLPDGYDGSIAVVSIGTPTSAGGKGS